MSRDFITDPQTVQELASQTDRGLSEIYDMALRGYVGTGLIVNSTRSHFYMDDGVLKFYNATTDTSSSVNLT